ncbi:hypothetical protein DFH09DRAFT_1332782 [Mycena vulgaris]|nr:hypothetical protein DFH09DRAFT_1332782 [Mycena vulgaris]
MILLQNIQSFSIPPAHFSHRGSLFQQLQPSTLQIGHPWSILLEPRFFPVIGSPGGFCLGVIRLYSAQARARVMAAPVDVAIAVILVIATPLQWNGASAVLLFLLHTHWSLLVAVAKPVSLGVKLQE